MLDQVLQIAGAGTCDCDNAATPCAHLMKIGDRLRVNAIARGDYDNRQIAVYERDPFCDRYLQPLIRGEAYPPYAVSGIPAYVALRQAQVEKKLAPWDE